MKANKFIVTGLTDAGKIPQIEKAIRTHDGINAVRVDMVANTVTVDYDEARYSEGDIKNFVSEQGLQVTHLK
jgi:copper chaperone CopZ